MTNDFLCSQFETINQPVRCGVLNWLDIVTAVSKPTIAPPLPTVKDAKLALPCLAAHSATAKTNMAVSAHGLMSLLWIDMDAGNIELEDILAKLVVCGIDCYAVHSTYTSTETAKKWRILIPLLKAVSVTEWRRLQLVLQRYFNGDVAVLKPAQVMFMPAIQAKDAFYIHHVVDGDMFNASSLNAIMQRALQAVLDEEHKQDVEITNLATKALAKPQKSGREGKIINLTNEAYTVANVLMAYGFIQLGHRYLHPHSTSNQAGVVILDAKYFSHHSQQTDVLADGHSHDSFDLLVVWRFDSDQSRAITVLANELDSDGNKERQRVFMQKNDPPATLATPATQGSDWEVEALPLTRAAETMRPYPIDALGEVLADTLEELTQTVQAPIPLVANSLLAAAGLVAQAYADVRLIHGKTAPCSLFAMTVGDSGERKSAIDYYVLSPIEAYQKKLAEQYRLDKSAYERNMEAYEAASRQAKSSSGRHKKSVEQIRDELESLGMPPTPPIEPVLLCSDPTPEGIFRQLAGGQPSIGLFSDEGGLFTSGFAMQDANKLATLARLSKLWEGAKFDRIRGGDGVNVLYHRRMSLHLMMQSVVAQSLFSDGIANEQGFLPRCLIAFPHSTAGGRWFTDRDPMNSHALKRYYAVMNSILETPKPTSEHNPQELLPPTLELNQAARAMLIAFHDEIECELNSNGKYFIIKGTANKIVEQASRIAGVIMVIEHGASVGLDGVMIDESIMHNAIRLAHWYLDEWLRIFNQSAVPKAIQLAQLLQRWVLSDSNLHRPYFYSRQIAQYGHHRLRNKTDMNMAIATLTEHGLCRQMLPMVLDGAKRQSVYEVRESLDCVAEVATLADHRLVIAGIKT
ncbi:MAG TPA: YfjI family protein [Thiotrichales bacterium]|nr:YfjI family protein [Thiotrichales bacterium]